MKITTRGFYCSYFIGAKDRGLDEEIEAGEWVAIVCVTAKDGKKLEKNV